MKNKTVSEQTNRIRENAEKEISALEKKIARFSKIAWGLIIGGIITTVFYFVLHTKGCLKLNEMGDFLTGTTGILWALSGIFFIYVAFLGQKQQLLYQSLEIHQNREELELTRDELAGQREALQEQSHTFKLQQFENTFFQLLQLQMKIRESIDVPINPIDRINLGYSSKDNEKRDLKGSDAFRQMSLHLLKKLRHSKQEINVVYQEFYESYQSDLGHYFRNLYRIVKFVDQSNLTLAQKYSYTSIVRAQLSNSELVLLFYNCLSPLVSKKFKPLIQRNALLKNLSNTDLAHPSHYGRYDHSAFEFVEQT